MSFLPAIDTVYTSLDQFKLDVLTKAEAQGLKLVTAGYIPANTCGLACAINVGSGNERCKFRIRVKYCSEGVKVTRCVRKHSCDATRREQNAKRAREDMRKGIQQLKEDMEEMGEAQERKDSVEADDGDHEEEEEVKYIKPEELEKEIERLKSTQIVVLPSSRHVLPSQRAVLVHIHAFARQRGFTVWRQSGKAGTHRMYCSHGRNNTAKYCDYRITAEADVDGKWRIVSASTEHNHPILNPYFPDSANQHNDSDTSDFVDDENQKRSVMHETDEEKNLDRTRYQAEPQYPSQLRAVSAQDTSAQSSLTIGRLETMDRQEGSDSPDASDFAKLPRQPRTSPDRSHRRRSNRHAELSTSASEDTDNDLPPRKKVRRSNRADSPSAVSSNRSRFHQTGDTSSIAALDSSVRNPGFAESASDVTIEASQQRSFDGSEMEHSQQKESSTAPAKRESDLTLPLPASTPRPPAQIPLNSSRSMHDVVSSRSSPATSNENAHKSVRIKSFSNARNPQKPISTIPSTAYEPLLSRQPKFETIAELSENSSAVSPPSSRPVKHERQQELSRYSRTRSSSLRTRRSQNRKQAPVPSDTSSSFGWLPAFFSRIVNAAIRFWPSSNATAKPRSNILPSSTSSSKSRSDQRQRILPTTFERLSQKPRLSTPSSQYTLSDFKSLLKSFGYSSVDQIVSDLDSIGISSLDVLVAIVSMEDETFERLTEELREDMANLLVEIREDLKQSLNGEGATDE